MRKSIWNRINYVILWLSTDKTLIFKSEKLFDTGRICYEEVMINSPFFEFQIPTNLDLHHTTRDSPISSQSVIGTSSLPCPYNTSPSLSTHLYLSLIENSRGTPGACSRIQPARRRERVWREHRERSSERGRGRERRK